MAVVSPGRLASTAAKPFRVLLAVSGGADSMALAYIASKCFGVICRAIIFDHGMRPESHDEAQLVAKRLSILGIDAYIHQLRLVDECEKKGSLQAIASQRRRDFLIEEASSFRADAVLTGHHADDQAETMLMRVTAGSSLAGYGGIAPTSYLHHSQRRNHGAWFLRPLLAATKTTLYALCKQNHVPWVEDPSNAKDIYTRNRLRHLLALIPNVRSGLAGLADMVGDGRMQAASLLAEPHMQVDEAALEMRLSLQRLQRLDRTAQQLTTAALHHAVSGSPLSNTDWAHLAKALVCSTGSHSTQSMLDLNGCWVGTTSDGQLVVRTKPTASSLPPLPLVRLTDAKSGGLRWRRWVLSLNGGRPSASTFSGGAEASMSGIFIVPFNRRLQHQLAREKHLPRTWEMVRSVPLHVRNALPAIMAVEPATGSAPLKAKHSPVVKSNRSMKVVALPSLYPLEDAACQWLYGAGYEWAVRPLERLECRWEPIMPGWAYAPSQRLLALRQRLITSFRHTVPT